MTSSEFYHAHQHNVIKTADVLYTAQEAVGRTRDLTVFGGTPAHAKASSALSTAHSLPGLATSVLDSQLRGLHDELCRKGRGYLAGNGPLGHPERIFEGQTGANGLHGTLD